MDILPLRIHGGGAAWLARPLSRRRYGQQRLACRCAARSGYYNASRRHLHDTRAPVKRRHYGLLGLGGTLVLSALLLWTTVPEARQLGIAVDRCGRIGVCVAASAIDYALLMRRDFKEEDAASEAVVAGSEHSPSGDDGQDRPPARKRSQAEKEAWKECHLRNAKRTRETMLRLGGIYVKLGQHISALNYLLPPEWCTTMAVLQDHANATSFKDVLDLLENDTGTPIDQLFSSIDPAPIGVASLAQVHTAVDRQTGQRVAVKVQHPPLDLYSTIDMKATTFLLNLLKVFFPEFEFTWLADEMNKNLPKELDFVHEKTNAERTTKNFASMRKTTLVVPRVLWCTRRAMCMEYVEGGRVDDLEYLAKHRIDRNRVSQELTRIFSQMIHIHGWFHADPHGGNVLVRPAQKVSRSPFNFEIGLLDHGLYFEIPDDLRLDYSRLWLSLISRSSDKVEADRRRYARKVANIDDRIYPIFASALTGRAFSALSSEGGLATMMPQSGDEIEKMQEALASQDGLLLDIAGLLRNLPRVMLMVFKTNDLTRSLDFSLETTHGSRCFVILARYCTLAVWLETVQELNRSLDIAGRRLMSSKAWGIRWSLFKAWTSHKTFDLGLAAAERYFDLQALLSKIMSATRGFLSGGPGQAILSARGLGER